MLFRPTLPLVSNANYISIVQQLLPKAMLMLNNVLLSNTNADTKECLCLVMLIQSNANAKQC